MLARKIRKLSPLLLPIGMLPFFLLDRSTLEATGGALWWLLGYPIVLAVIIILLLPPKPVESLKSRKGGSKEHDADSLKDEDVTALPSSQYLDELTDPSYKYLSTNIHHRDSAPPFP